MTNERFERTDSSDRNTDTAERPMPPRVPFFVRYLEQPPRVRSGLKAGLKPPASEDGPV
jgi:hypothetical protein